MNCCVQSEEMRCDHTLGRKLKREWKREIGQEKNKGEENSLVKACAIIINVITIGDYCQKSEMLP